MANIEFPKKAYVDSELATKLDTANKASQVEAEAGTDNTKYMTPLATAQAIAELAPTGGGSAGADGDSAYEIAVTNGFSGTESEWLASLVGEQGIQGIQGIQGEPGTNGTNGTNGIDGADGLSAYEVAVDNGFSGTESEWLASLVGEAGSGLEENPTLVGVVTQAGASVLSPTVVSALAIDTTKRLNTKSISADSTFTFSGSPATGQTFSLHLTNTDSTAKTITIPSSFSINLQALRTTFTIQANGEEFLTWRKEASRYVLTGDPVTLSDLTEDTSPDTVDYVEVLVSGSPRKVQLGNLPGGGGGGGSGNLTVSATEPTEPSHADEWIDTATGIRYTYYNDGTSSQWVEFGQGISVDTEVVADPVFDPVSGSITSGDEVAITTTTSGASIRYTVDGSTPSSTVGTVYSVPVAVTDDVTIKAIAYKTGAITSSVITEAFTVFPTVSGTPTINTAGTQLTISFSEAVQFGAGGNAGLTLASTGDAVTLTYASGSGTTSLVYDTSRIIISTETISNLTYVQPGNGIEDALGNDLASFSGVAVTNNSEEAGVTFDLNVQYDTGDTPAGWNAPSSGAVTFGYATGAWKGAGAMSSTSMANGYFSFTPRASGWYYTEYKATTGWMSGSYGSEVAVRAADSAALVIMRIQASGATQGAVTIYTNSTDSAPSTYLLDLDVVYRILIYHEAGGTALLYVWPKSSTTQPTVDGTGGVVLSRLVGNSFNCGRFSFNNSNTSRRWWDNTLISSTNPGGNPNP